MKNCKASCISWEEAHCIMRREAWRNGELWIRVFPNILITNNSTEVRMRNTYTYENSSLWPTYVEVQEYNFQQRLHDNIWCYLGQIGEYEIIENLIGTGWEYQNLFKISNGPFFPHSLAAIGVWYHDKIGCF